MIWGLTQIPGWFYSAKWGYYQKTNERVVCYISRRLYDGYIMQLYKRGQMSMCDIEFRSHNLDELLDVAGKWLVEFKDGNLEEIHNHYYSPHNHKGYWAVEYPKRHTKEVHN